MNKTKVCIITNSKNYKGGITAVVSGYHGSKLEDDFSIHYVESCSDSHLKITKAGKMLLGYIQFFFELVFLGHRLYISIHRSDLASIGKYIIST